MAEESTESLQAQIRTLEGRIEALEEAVKPENISAAIAKRQRNLSV